jgi:hypothetical protein
VGSPYVQWPKLPTPTNAKGNARIKLYACLINKASRHESVWESVDTAAQFLTSALHVGEERSLELDWNRTLILQTAAHPCTGSIRCCTDLYQLVVLACHTRKGISWAAERISAFQEGFCSVQISGTLKCNFSSTLYPQSCWLYNSSYTQSVIYI